MLTNVGYEVAVPERWEELILSLFSQNIKVIIDAYILGTLFHYLVKKDPEVEAARDLMAGLNLYCKERSLPSELTRKMEAHLLFQQRKSSVISTSVLRARSTFLMSWQLGCTLACNVNGHAGALQEDIICVCFCRACLCPYNLVWPKQHVRAP